MGPEYYVNIMSFVDKSQLEPGCAVLLHNKGLNVVGVLADDDRPLVFYSDIVIETCQPGYVPSKVVPSRSICQATCQLSETLQCRQADCAPKPFDYSDCVVVQVCAARADLYHKCHHDAAE